MTHHQALADVPDPFDPMAGTLQGTGRIVYSPDYKSEQQNIPKIIQGAVCRGCYAFGSACGHCARCMADPMRPMHPPKFDESANLTESSSSHAVVLTLPYPISANRYWASRTIKPRSGPSFTSTYVTKEAKEYKAQVAKLAAVAGIRRPIAGRVRLDLTLYPHRPLDWQKRMRTHGAAWDDTVQCLDLDNAQKVVLDSLKDVAFQDDAWVREIHARRAEPDEFGARLMVTVTAMAVETHQRALL